MPDHKRRKCIFRDKCSNYVYRITNDEGFISGCKALYKRYKQCRPGYKIIKMDNEEVLVELIEGTLKEIREMNIKI